jgi:dihydroorotase
LRDNEGTEVTAERLLHPLFCLRAGQRCDADAPILPMAQAA